MIIASTVAHANVIIDINGRHNKTLPLTIELRNELVIEANRKAFSLGEYK